MASSQAGFSINFAKYFTKKCQFRISFVLFLVPIPCISWDISTCSLKEFYEKFKVIHGEPFYHDLSLTVLHGFSLSQIDLRGRYHTK